MKLTDSEIKYQALKMWINFIETGNVLLSANDIINMGGKPRILSTEQRELIVRLNNLADKEINSSISNPPTLKIRGE